MGSLRARKADAKSTFRFRQSLAATCSQRCVRARVGISFEAWRSRGGEHGQRMVLDRAEWFGFAAGVVGDSSHHRELRQLAFCAEVYSYHDCFSSVACGRYPRSTRLLDFSRRIDFATALVRDCVGCYWTGAGRETDRTIRGTLMRPLRYWNGTRYCQFLALAKARAQHRYPERSRPSEQRRPAPKAAQPYRREAEGAYGRVARSLQPAAGMRLTRSLPYAPSASTRGPFQYFNGLI